MEEVLDDNGMCDNTKIYILKPIILDEQQLAHWKKDTKKSRRISLEGVRDKIVSNLYGKETTFSI